MFKNVTKEELVVPAQMHHLREIRDFITYIGKKYKFDDKITNSFKLVVDEACTNIVRHGYRDIKDGKITIRAIIRRLSLTIVLIDQGKSFDPRQVKNPNLDKYVEIGKKGGLGIFMMRKLMDDIQYHITSHGNELRLTKTRESAQQSKLREWWEPLLMRTKFSLVVSAIISILAIIIFVSMNTRLSGTIHQRVFKQGKALSLNFANLAWEPLTKEITLSLFETAKSIKESQPKLIYYSILTDSSFKRVLASYPVNMGLISKGLSFQTFALVDSLQNNVKIYKAALGDTSFYSFTAPVQLKGVDTAPIGYAMVWVKESYIRNLLSHERNNLIISFLIILAIAYVATFLLIRIIMEPFHQLAEWVRQVGRGTVDQDEIDIDASDELGEIAQAFNEMTGKFRESQQSLIEQQRLRKELQVAQEIQQMLLPDDFPDVIGYDIASYYQAAKEVGGDLFDFVEVDDQSIGICVADVSGKGVPGSLVMTMIRTALRLEARGNKNAAEVLSKVNTFVTDDIRKGMFVTMFYVYLDSRERMVSFASAGHNPMILYRGKSEETYYLNPSGFPVGITLPDINLFREKIQMDRIRLHPDDMLVLYTDGITEAMNSSRELYGEERFLAAIRKFGHLDVAEFVRSVKDDILSFTGGFEQNDDITLVAIKENMAAVDVKLNLFKDLFEGAKKKNSMTIKQACEQAGISTSTYYRYKKLYEKGGYEHLREMLHGFTNLGLKHLSIETKTKMYDIIGKHPTWGAKRISNTLNSEEYGNLKVKESLIYEELKRAKLNTKRQRLLFVQRGGKRRLKPPGTPLLTLDGEVMVGYRTEETPETPFGYVPPDDIESRPKEKIIVVKTSEKNPAGNGSEIEAAETTDQK